MVGISGLGVYIPENKIDVSELVAEKTEYERNRIGVNSVLYEPKLTAVEMAVKASEMAIKSSGITAENIDVIINTQATVHDYLMWIAAAELQYRLGAVNASFMDIYQGCSGFVEGIKIAASYIESGRAKRVLVASAEKWNCSIRERCLGRMVYGECGSAIILEKNCTDNVIIGESHISRGDLNDISRIRVGTVCPPENDYPISYYNFDVIDLEKSKRELLPVNVDNFYLVGKKATENAGISLDEIDNIIFPDAGFGLFEKVIKRYDFDISKTNFEYVPDTGDCGTADVFLSYYRMFKDKKLKKGNNVLVLAQGAGYVWNAVIIKV